MPTISSATLYHVSKICSAESRSEFRTQVNMGLKKNTRRRRAPTRQNEQAEATPPAGASRRQPRVARMSVFVKPRKTIGKKASRKNELRDLESPSTSRSPSPQATISFPKPRTVVPNEDSDEILPAPTKTNNAPARDAQDKGGVSRSKSIARAQNTLSSEARGVPGSRKVLRGNATPAISGADRVVPRNSRSKSSTVNQGSKKTVKVTYVETNDVGSHWVRVDVSSLFLVAIFCYCGCNELVKVGKYGKMSPERSVKCVHCGGGGEEGFNSHQELINHLNTKTCRIA
ncbi:hypothetical protein FGB62_41g211 [Gracilaria domingensis]|nr:hypothetical protein FGB62_41g211 [Gracilaria domingensis]